MPREQRVSSLTTRLERFCQLSGAISVALVDAEGETVDYAGCRAAFDVRLGAAECRLVLQLLAKSSNRWLQEAQQLLFRGQRRSYLTVALAEGYALVIQLPNHSFRVSLRALCVLVREVGEDTGLSVPATWTSHWTAVRVECSRQRPHRPIRISVRGQWESIEVVGVVAGPPVDVGESGYRVRLGSGAELTLVRERLNRWYADPDTVLRQADA